MQTLEVIYTSIAGNALLLPNFFIDDFGLPRSGTDFVMGK